MLFTYTQQAVAHTYAIVIRSTWAVFLKERPCGPWRRACSKQSTQLGFRGEEKACREKRNYIPGVIRVPGACAYCCAVLCMCDMITRVFVRTIALFSFPHEIFLLISQRAHKNTPQHEGALRWHFGDCFLLIVTLPKMHAARETKGNESENLQMHVFLFYQYI